MLDKWTAAARVIISSALSPATVNDGLQSNEHLMPETVVEAALTALREASVQLARALRMSLLPPPATEASARDEHEPTVQPVQPGRAPAVGRRLHGLSTSRVDMQSSFVKATLGALRVALLNRDQSQPPPPPVTASSMAPASITLPARPDAHDGSTLSATLATGTAAGTTGRQLTGTASTTSTWSLDKAIFLFENHLRAELARLSGPAVTSTTWRVPWSARQIFVALTGAPLGAVNSRQFVADATRAIARAVAIASTTSTPTTAARPSPPAARAVAPCTSTLNTATGGAAGALLGAIHPALPRPSTAVVFDTRCSIASTADVLCAEHDSLGKAVLFAADTIEELRRGAVFRAGLQSLVRVLLDQRAHLCSPPFAPGDLLPV